MKDKLLAALKSRKSVYEKYFPSFFAFYKWKSKIFLTCCKWLFFRFVRHGKVYWKFPTPLKVYNGKKLPALSFLKINDIYFNLIGFWISHAISKKTPFPWLLFHDGVCYHSYRNQSTDLKSKSMDWFLYDSDLRHEIKELSKAHIQHTCIRLFLIST